MYMSNTTIRNVNITTGMIGGETYQQKEFKYKVVGELCSKHGLGDNISNMILEKMKGNMNGRSRLNKLLNDSVLDFATYYHSESKSLRMAIAFCNYELETLYCLNCCVRKCWWEIEDNQCHTCDKIPVV